MIIYINGRFLAQKVTGVQRYAIETIKEMDKLNLNTEIIILHPKNIINKLELSNIKLQQIGKNTGHLWEQLTLPIYLRKKNKHVKLLSFGNIAPILFPGYVVIHDISFKTHPSHLNWKFVLWYRIITRLNIKRYKHIFTDSEFSKNEILKNYNIKEENITVTYLAAEHIKNIEPDENIIKKLDLENKEFCFSLGSKSPHKNIKYVMQCAKNNPKMIFIVSGAENKIFKEEERENVRNLIFTGYITDNQLVTLYKKCKCFIFPSLYEGFGIPPLEAINVGCKNIFLSDIPVFREIYGDNVNYIKENVILKLENEIESIEIDDKFLSKYTWDKIANKISEKIVKGNY